ncbi:adenosylcobinamide-GDP ribazoletransferase [Hirschia litorea]|uniref:Adenosylcobinamide-GDP ribazoletransferase n=1 Tax=Hirschia litorea TaxID=1199156 RepID=A0ABW2IHN1_9PROT
MISAIRNEISVFLLAVQFLTRLCLPSAIGFTPARLASAPAYFPLVGLLIGACIAGAYGLLSTVFSTPISILISTGISLALTGAFHEDGLADTFDGIGGGHTKDKSLEIMKDSRLGTYGSCALILALLIKIGALIELGSSLIMPVIIFAHGLSRLSSVLVIASSRYVRNEGTGKPTATGISIFRLIFALGVGSASIAIFSIFVSLSVTLFALLGLLIGHVIARMMFEKKLGGYTGDTLGAVQQFSEIGIYLGILACL